MNQKSGAARCSSEQGFTDKQGQYLAFIYAYSRMFRRPPAEADMQRHFLVSPPSVHHMVLSLERAASSGAAPASPEASNCSSPRKPCPS
jgi:hypothetical protein